MREGAGSRPWCGKATSWQWSAERAGGNRREDLRQSAAPAVAHVAAGHRPRVHADRRRPLRGRGRPAHPRRRPGAVAVGVLVQPRAAAQVPARLGAGQDRRAAGRRPAGPPGRRPRLVEPRHRRHRAPGLAAGPPRLAGVRPADAGRRRRPRRRAVGPAAAGQRRRTALARGRGGGGVGPQARPGADRGALHPAAVLRPPLGRGRAARRRAARRARHRPRGGRRGLPGLRRDRAVGAVTRADLAGAAGGRHAGRPRRAGAAGRRRRIRRRGLVVLRTAAVPHLLREPDAHRRRLRGHPRPARPGRARPPRPPQPPQPRRRGPAGPRSASAASPRPPTWCAACWTAGSPTARTPGTGATSKRSAEPGSAAGRPARAAARRLPRPRPGPYPGEDHPQVPGRRTRRCPSSTPSKMSTSSTM